MESDRPIRLENTLNVVETGSVKCKSRRAFFADVGKKVAYVPPVLLTFSARQALASAHAASCKPLAGPCSSYEDCCSNNCNTGICI